MNTVKTPASPPGRDPEAGGPALSPKLALLQHLRDTVPEGVRWALRGGRSGMAVWMASHTVKDLDLWVHRHDIQAFVGGLAPVTVGTVSLESDTRWLQHLVLVMPERFGGQLLDISYGDLKVGGALTCREGLITTRTGSHGPMLAGVAAVSDLLLRKLLRGKGGSPARLAEAELHWHTESAAQRQAWREDLKATFGATLANRVEAILAGRRITPGGRLTFVLAAVRASLRGSGLPLMLRRRRRLVLGRRQRVLLKRPVAPVLFLLSGERAATQAVLVEQVLASAGVTTQRIQPDSAGGSRWERVARLVKAAVYGHAAILCGEPGVGGRLLLPVRIWGEPIRLSVPASGAEILKRYYQAAHRWYIDDPVLFFRSDTRDEGLVRSSTGGA